MDLDLPTLDLPTLAVTGVTGSVGGMVAQHLADAGIAQRLLARTPTRSPQLARAITLPFSYADRALALQALEGVETLFMVSGSEAPDRVDQHRAFIDAAHDAGVQHIVYTSFLAAAPDAVFTLGRDHYATEEHIRSVGLAYTFLRDNFYLDFLPLLAGSDGVIRGPAGDGRVSAVARADVARVAATVLQDPSAHRNVSYDLTGREALSLAEVADLMSAQLGTTIAYHNETVEEAYASRASYGAPGWEVDAWVSTYTSIAAGDQAAISPDVERITGHPPLTLAEVLAAS
jgi:NAD(P)H dehydrogenase (quinone)